MSKTYRKVNPAIAGNDFYNDDLHVRGDGNVRSDKFSGWMLDYGKENGIARHAHRRSLRSAERRALSAIMAHGVDPDEVLFPLERGTGGWLTH
jgi:hypothetical protein